MISIGRLAPSDPALKAIAAAGISPAELLARHARGERGDIMPWEIELTEEDIADKPTSIYMLGTGDAIWITTDTGYGQPITTMLLLAASWLGEFRVRG